MNQKTEIRDGMKIDWNVPLTMDDGIVLRAETRHFTDNGDEPILSFPSHGGRSSFNGYPAHFQGMSGQGKPDVWPWTICK